MIKFFLALFTVFFFSAASDAQDLCTRLQTARDAISPHRHAWDAQQEKTLAIGFKTLSAAAKSLDGQTSDACMDAFALLSHRLLKADSSLEGIETFGEFRKRHPEAADRAIARMKPDDRKFMEAKLRIFDAAEKDAAAAAAGAARKPQAEVLKRIQ